MSVNIKAVLKGSAISLAITIVILFVLSVLAYFTNLSDTIVIVGAYAAIILGVMTGAVLISRGAPEKKLMHVALLCSVFTAVLVAVSFIMNGGITFNGHTAGIVGGIVGAAFLGAIIGNR